jgi:hypothetical protein
MPHPPSQRHISLLVAVVISLHISLLIDDVSAFFCSSGLTVSPSRTGASSSSTTSYGKLIVIRQRSPQPQWSQPSRSSLYSNSQNIRHATEMTERYGIHSPEAKLAWEIVEEYDGRDNSAAYQPNLDNMMSEEQLNAAYEELQYTLDVLQRQRPRSFAHNPDLMKDIAAELQSIKLAPPESKPAPKIRGLWDAKLKARAMSQQYGNDSVEAKLAWEEVEELASTGLDNAIGGYETCDLGQAAEACLALEELDRFLHFEQQYNDNDRRSNDDDRIDYSGQYVENDDGGRAFGEGGSPGGSPGDNYVGGYYNNVDNNLRWDDNYVDEVNNGNYQDWNDNYYGDDASDRGYGQDGDGNIGGSNSNFDNRRYSYKSQDNNDDNSNSY